MGQINNFVVSTMGVMWEFTVHEEPIEVASAIMEQAPTQNTMVPVALCATIQTLWRNMAQY